MSIRFGATMVPASVNLKKSTNLYSNRSRNCRLSVRSCVSDSQNAYKIRSKISYVLFSPLFELEALSDQVICLCGLRSGVIESSVSIKDLTLKNSATTSPLLAAFQRLLDYRLLHNLMRGLLCNENLVVELVEQLVLEVKERLAKDCNTLPIGKNGRDDEEMILWFLKDRRFSVDEAIGKLTKAIKWHHEFKVNEISEDSVRTAANTGKAYVHGFLDVKGRPVVVVAPAKHNPGLLDPTEDEKLCVFLLEKALSKLPTGQDKILGIFDLRGFGSHNADLKFLTFLFDVFYYYYPSRLDQVLFVDAPFIFQPIWQFTKPVVKSYASLVKFCSAETVRKEYFTEETLPSNFRS